MNIILLGHHDLASLFALNRLVSLRPEHEFTVFTSGTLTAPEDIPAALVELARIDTALCGQYLEEHPVADVLRNARELTAPNSPAGLQTLADCRPDLIVSIRYRRILRDAAIAIPALGVLNLHSGILPDYKGVMATFWAMLNDEPELGTSLHRIVDSGVDTGPLIAISRTPANSQKSYLANVLSLYANGCEQMACAISDLACGKDLPGDVQVPDNGRYFSTPDQSAIERFLARNLRLASGLELQALRARKT